MSWVNPQQYSIWATMHGAPPGWQGPWPPTAPAGYPGPPPVPAGVNPQAWTSGQWQVNPSFRGSVVGPHAAIHAWAPHPSWGPQGANANAAAGANFNPYKRVPNPGGAEYWSTKLKDNGLGLENMHIRDNVSKKTQDNGVMHTPWVWVPRELCKSPEQHDQAELRDGQGRPNEQDQHDQNHETRSQPHSHDRSVSSSDAYRQSRQGPEPYNGYNNSSASRDQRPETKPSHQRADSTASRPPDRTRSDGNVVPERIIPGSAPAHVSSYSAYSRQQQQQQPQQQQPQQQQPQQQQRVSPRESHPQTRDIRTSPDHPATSSVTSSSSASAAAAAATRAPTTTRSASEAFSSKQELHPTFSPSIIRTPNHYSSASTSTPTRRTSSDDPYTSSASTSTPSRRMSGDDAHAASVSTPTRRASHDDAGRTPSRPPVSPHSHGPIYAPPSNTPSRSNSLSKRQSSAPPASSASASASSSAPATSSSAPSLPFLANFSEEPVGLLSPLVTPTRSTGGSSPGGREVSRSQTFPSFSGSNFDTIPEDRALSHPRTPRPAADQHRDPHATPYVNPRSPTRSSRVSPDTAPRPISRSQTYPVIDPSSSSRTSPNSSKSPSASRSRGPSPSRTARMSHNPLPQPPMPTTFSTSSASVSSSAAPSTPQNAGYRKVRKGFWNRRGDHLTLERNSQFIVYAPRHLANPPELAQYPVPLEGFMDHHGKKVKYDPSVPELPESLPLHGEPPSRPYEHFVQYI